MLTDAECRGATCPPELKKRRLTDGGGLYLEVTPNGSKRWFWRYASGGKVRALPLGSYCKPGGGAVLVGPKAARAARDAARAIKSAGDDPLQARRADKLAKAASSATTYEAVAREFHATKSAAWSEGHGTKWLRMNELYLFPHLGALPLSGITPPMLLGALRKVERKGILSTAQDLRSMAGQVFRFGVQTGRCERNPAVDLTDALKPHVAKHFAAILDPVEAGALLRAIDGYTGQPTTRAALVLASLLFQRPGNIRAMEWAWLDLEAKMLTIPAAEMKLTKGQKLNARPRLVPLARQAVAVLKSLQPLTGGEGCRYVFPSARTGERPMSDNTLNAALRRLDYGTNDHVAHGFRAMARTMMKERLSGIDPEVVEAQLGHGKSGPLGAAYDRSEYLVQRRQIMQTWADYLDKLRAGAEVLPLKAA